MSTDDKLTHIVDLMDSQTFRTLVANWQLIDAASKNPDETRLAVANVGARMLSALDENRITFSDEKDRDLLHLALGLLLHEAIESTLANLPAGTQPDDPIFTQAYGHA
ncbi:MAG: hypothetical protein PHR16_17820 [Methylovulum sp.]|nr:hypothetical protein [Methylovulum sp.]